MSLLSPIMRKRVGGLSAAAVHPLLLPSMCSVLSTIQQDEKETYITLVFSRSPGYWAPKQTGQRNLMIIKYKKLIYDILGDNIKVFP